MSDGWWIGIIGAGLIGWAILLDVRYGSELRLARWWVPRARRMGRWAGPVAFVGSCAALAGYAVLAVLGGSLASAAGDSHWALVVALPAMLGYAPFVFATMPTRFRGYDAWRSHLAAAGAVPRLQRAIAWWAGPPSLLGLIAMIATLAAIFLD